MFSYVFYNVSHCYLLLVIDEFQLVILCIYSVPWNQNTILGYFAEEFSAAYCGAMFLLLNGVILLLFISICVNHRAFHKMVEHFIEKWSSIDSNSIEDEQFIRDLLKFHTSIKE